MLRMYFKNLNYHRKLTPAANWENRAEKEVYIVDRLGVQLEAEKNCAFNLFSFIDYLNLNRVYYC